MSTPDSDVIQPPSSPDPMDLWPALHRRLQKLGVDAANGPDFETQLSRLDTALTQALAERSDDSLFVLVQMLHDLRHSYSVSHALLAAVTCQLAGPLAGIQGERLKALSQAALTMNIGMRALQYQLASQTQPLDLEQRQVIEQHP